jgi:hypothetical protein
MEPVASVVDKIKGVAKSGQDFVDGLLRRRENSSRRNPVLANFFSLLLIFITN